jgi:hypothetical protein
MVVGDCIIVVVVGVYGMCGNYRAVSMNVLLHLVVKWDLRLGRKVDISFRHVNKKAIPVSGLGGL